VSFAGNIVYLLCGIVALISAFATVTASSPIRAALSLLVHIVALAGLFLTLHAHMLAFVQLIVYAGAVVVLFVFVIMYIGTVPASEGLPAVTFSRTFSTAAVLLLTAVTVAVVSRLSPRWVGIPGCAPGGSADCGQFGGVEALSRSLFRDGVVPFELVGILLTVAVVGAVMVARNPGKTQQGSRAGAEETPTGDAAGNGKQ
jgi:NADH-quinone oxidoreductase subunit J